MDRTPWEVNWPVPLQVLPHIHESRQPHHLSPSCSLSFTVYVDQKHSRSGLALFSSGSVWNKHSPNSTGPANMTKCIFERNKAVDGGAMYSAAGYDMINSSWFEGNLAGMSPSVVSRESSEIPCQLHRLVFDFRGYRGRHK